MASRVQSACSHKSTLGVGKISTYPRFPVVNMRWMDVFLMTYNRGGKGPSSSPHA